MSVWTAVGWLGNGLYFSRFLVQWLRSERAGKSVVPPLFWWLSLAGTVCLFAYTLQEGDSILLFGYAFTFVLYLRNLVLSSHEKEARAWGPLRVLSVASVGWLLLVILGVRGVTSVAGAPLYVIAIGIVGQAVWSSRFFVQWFYAERHGSDHFPLVFWQISLAGNSLLLTYACFTGDPVWIAGLAVGPLVQIRNLQLMRRTRQGHAGEPA